MNMETKALGCYIVFLQLIRSIFCQTSNVGILVNSQQKTASPGQKVIFDCQVANLGSNKVTWTFLTHQLLISRGDEIVQTQNTKYDLGVDEATATYNLIINHIVQEDGGDYQCLVEGTSISVVHHLYVAGSESYPTTDPDGTPANFTDCCLHENVTAPCLPLCSPSTFVFDGFNPNVCAGDLLKLLKCGSDGRNHVSCCRQRLLPDVCLDYCLGEVPSAPIEQQTVCLDKALDIIDCFEEGQGILPGPPLFPQAIGQSPTEIKVTWSKPVDGGDKVTGYRVFHQKAGDSVWQSSDLVSSTTLNRMLYSLQPATEYSIYIIAIGDHGASLPSFIVKTWTYSDSQLPPDTDSLDLFACCQKRKVTSQCQSFLCAGSYEELSAKDKVSCFTQVDKIYSCLADEKDHRPCCAQRGLPDRCLKLCQGYLIGTTFDDIDCLNYMPEVANCIQENKDTIPGPPGDIRVTEVTSSSALISWIPPSHNPEKLQSYTLVYKEYYSGLEHAITGLTNTSQLLDDLQPSMFYEVKVKSVGHLATSLASESVIFLTYYEHGGVLASTPAPVSTTATPPHTVQECCLANGVLPECQPLCNYTADHASFDVFLLLRCEESIGHILQCGVDGRNHEACCEMREVTDYCLRYCSFTKEQAATFQFNIQDIVCLKELDAVLQCMQEGVVNIPSQPRSVSVVEVTEFTVSLQWSEPAQNADKVTGYRVKVNQTSSNTSLTIVTTATSYIVQNLVSDSLYDLTVSAFGEAGASLPSPVFSVRTLAEKRYHQVNVTLPTDISDCCMKGNVSAACLPVCSESQLVNLHECGAEMGVVLECAADQKDHTSCCRRQMVSDHCLSFCQGNVDVKDFTSLICLGFTEQILACFREGYNKLPSTPSNFHVREVSVRYITVGWDPSSQTSASITYQLYYKEQRSHENFDYIENVTSPYRLGNLQPFTHYQVYVVAVNVYGASPPTPVITIWSKLEEGPTIQVRQDPTGVLKEETTGVILTCSSSSQPPPSIYWKRNNQKVSDSGSYKIDVLKREDTGRYVCVATSSGRTAVADHYLKVMYHLEVTSLQSRVEVAPSCGLTAVLQCDFKGQPQSIYWLKDGSTFPPVNDTSNRFSTSFLINLDEGITTSQLSIFLVRRADFGQYSCLGQNDLGAAHTQIDLVNSEPEEEPEPTLSPAPPVNNVKGPLRFCQQKHSSSVKECCDNNNVQEPCKVACAFDVDFKEIMNMTDCLPDLPSIIGCAADGRDHTKCCVAKSVPSICLPFCLGIVEDLDNDHLVCFTHFKDMVTCLEEGHEKIPNTPTDIKASLKQGYIEVSWTEPSQNSEYVQTYQIHYSYSRDVHEQVTVVSHQIRNVQLSGILSYKTYTIYVVAVNHYGKSHNSTSVTVTTQEQAPGSPQYLKEVSVSGHEASLSWQLPVVNPGAVQSYQIYYGVVGKTKKQQESTSELSVTLSGLEVATHYEIYVTAKSEHYESNPSNVIVINTTKESTTPGEGTVTPKPQIKSADSKESVGIGVGVALGLLLVGLIVFILAYLLVQRLRDKNSHMRFTDSSSVVFENSGFSKPARVEIAGFRGESSSDFQNSLTPSDYQPCDRKPPLSPNDSNAMSQDHVSNGNGMSRRPNEVSVQKEEVDPVQNPLYATLEVEQHMPSDAQTTGSINPGFHATDRQ